ncbi:MAG TPA: DNA modification methylase [Tepidisphaeraceae bacterium]|jgi:site-specific DNA-methyltransferase (adenine-specific)
MSKSVLKPHPFAELLPMMSEADYAALKADVIANGRFNDPAVNYKGMRLDGRNRQRVSDETGIKLPTIEFKGTEADALRYVYSKAVHRNMGDSQKAAAAVNFLPHFEAEAKQRQDEARRRGGKSSTTDEAAATGIKLVSGKTRAQWRAKLNQTGRKELERRYALHVGWLSGDMWGLVNGDMVDRIIERMFGPEQPADTGKSRDAAGGLFGVSGRYVAEARKVRDADPELFRAVFEGRETVNRAKLQLHRRSRASAAKAAARSGRLVSPDDCTILVGDALREMEKLPRGKFRLVFADPPYNLGFTYDADPTKDALPPIKYCHLTHAWIKEAAELLTPDGALCWMIPEEWVIDAGGTIREVGLHMRRLIVWHESFGQNGKSNFGRTCRFIWYATKSKTDFVFDAGSILVESKRSSVYNDPRAMPDGKVPDALWDFSRVAGTFAERIPDEGIPTQLPVDLVTRAVRCFTEIGDVVLDPFGGTGTTARAALRCGRKCVTIERSRKYAAIIRRELLAISKGDSHAA